MKTEQKNILIITAHGPYVPIDIKFAGTSNPVTLTMPVARAKAEKFQLQSRQWDIILTTTRSLVELLYGDDSETRSIFEYAISSDILFIVFNSGFCDGPYLDTGSSGITKITYPHYLKMLFPWIAQSYDLGDLFEGKHITIVDQPTISNIAKLGARFAYDIDFNFDSDKKLVHHITIVSERQDNWVTRATGVIYKSGQRRGVLLPTSKIWVTFGEIRNSFGYILTHDGFDSIRMNTSLTRDSIIERLISNYFIHQITTPVNRDAGDTYYAWYKYEIENNLDKSNCFSEKEIKIIKQKFNIDYHVAIDIFRSQLNEVEHLASELLAFSENTIQSSILSHKTSQSKFEDEKKAKKNVSKIESLYIYEDDLPKDYDFRKIRQKLICSKHYKSNDLKKSDVHYSHGRECFNKGTLYLILLAIIIIESKKSKEATSKKFLFNWYEKISNAKDKEKAFPKVLSLMKKNEYICIDGEIATLAYEINIFIIPKDLNERI